MTPFSIDIETKPKSDEEIKKIIPAFDEEAVKYGNVRDEKKRADLLERKRAEHTDKYLQKAALYAHTGEVLMVSFFEDRRGFWWLDAGQQGEEGLLVQTWETLNNRATYKSQYIVGHGILDFDLPFLFRRSMMLGVKVPTPLWELGKDCCVYWYRRFFDTCRFWKASKYGDTPATYNDVALAMGTPTKPKDVSGKLFHVAWEEDQTAALEYARNDVEGPYRWVQQWDCLFDPGE